MNWIPLITLIDALSTQLTRARRSRISPAHVKASSWQVIPKLILSDQDCSDTPHPSGVPAKAHPLPPAAEIAHQWLGWHGLLLTLVGAQGRNGRRRTPSLEPPAIRAGKRSTKLLTLTCSAQAMGNACKILCQRRKEELSGGWTSPANPHPLTPRRCQPLKAIVWTPPWLALNTLTSDKLLLCIYRHEKAV